MTSLRPRSGVLPALARSVRVAVIGAPNAGKSLLTNQLVRADVAAVSCKMDTTRKNQIAVLTQAHCQLVVVDSPGTIGLQHARSVVGATPEGHILTDPESAIAHADRVLVVQDASETGDYIQHRVLHLLHRHAHIPSSLVMNKVDLVTRRSDLLPLVRVLTKARVAGMPIQTKVKAIGRLGVPDIDLHVDVKHREGDVQWRRKYEQLIARPTHRCSWTDTKRVFIDERGWDRFDAVFFVSALLGEGIDALREHLMQHAEKRPWQYDEDTVTSTSPQEICLQAIRAQLLDAVPAHIAYVLDLQIVSWEMQSDVLQIVVEIHCAKQRWTKYVLGPGGKRVVGIGTRVNQRLQNLFRQQLFVRLLVKHGDVIAPIEMPSRKRIKTV